MPESAPNPNSRRGNRRRLGPRSGQSMVEFALSFLLFLSIVLGFAQLALAVWLKTTLHHCVRESVRFAVTGNPMPGMGHVDSIKQRIVETSAGLVTTAQLSTNVNVRFFDSTGAEVTGTGANAGGNTVLVQVVDYPVPLLASPLVTLVPSGLKVSAAEVGRLEPYTTPPTL